LSEYLFSITIYDAGKPWIVLSREHRIVQLADGVDFAQWARQEYPDAQTTVQLDPPVQQPWPTRD
jgi:hypothetical protein